MVFLGRARIREGSKWRITLLFKDGDQVVIKETYVDASLDERTIDEIIKTEVKKIISDANKQPS